MMPDVRWTGWLPPGADFCLWRGDANAENWLGLLCGSKRKRMGSVFLCLMSRRGEELQHPIRGLGHRSFIRVRRGAAACTSDRTRVTTDHAVTASGESLDRPPGT
jgi:hypothetical protein